MAYLLCIMLMLIMVGSFLMVLFGVILACRFPGPRPCVVLTSTLLALERAVLKDVDSTCLWRFLLSALQLETQVDELRSACLVRERRWWLRFLDGFTELPTTELACCSCFPELRFFCLPALVLPLDLRCGESFLGFKPWPSRVRARTVVWPSGRRFFEFALGFDGLTGLLEPWPCLLLWLCLSLCE